MMKLTVTLTDNGKPREAIPVRAVPLVTDWYISPDRLAIALSGEDGVFRYHHTAHIQSEGELKEIPPADWRLIADQLHALHASLPAGEAGKYEWRRRSIAELPAAAFLWADELYKAYRRAHNEAAHLEHFAGEPLHTTGEVRIPTVITDELQCIALEGFQSAPDMGATAKTPIQLEPQPTSHTNDTRTRTSPLAAEIKKAKTLALDGCDYQSVWSALLEMALEEEGAFTGETDTIKGLEYEAHNGNGNQTRKWLSKNALRKRMGREAR